MKKPKPGALFIQAWVSEVSGVTRRPSWIARKLSTHPPKPSLPPAGLPGASAETRPGTQAPAAIEEVIITPLPAPPPPGPVDITTSVALAQLADENAALRAQITEMAATMARLRREVLEASEGELVRLALSIAERVVGRELECEPTLVAEWAREAIEEMAAKDGVVIAVARDVRDDLPDAAWIGVGADHRVQTDPQLAPGAIEVRTPEGTVATHAAARLAAVAHALGADES